MIQNVAVGTHREQKVRLCLCHFGFSSVPVKSRIYLKIHLILKKRPNNTISPLYSTLMSDCQFTPRVFNSKMESTFHLSSPSSEILNTTWSKPSYHGDRQVKKSHFRDTENCNQQFTSPLNATFQYTPIQQAACSSIHE